MAKKNKTTKLIVIEFFSGELRLLEGRWGKNGFSDLRYKTFSIPEGIIENGRILNPQLMENFLKTSVQKAGFSTKNAALVLNSGDIVLREINIPQVADDEIESIINFRAQDIFPGGAENMAIDYLVLKKTVEDEVEKLVLLLIAIPKDIVISFFSAIEAAGLEPVIMEYQPNAFAKFFAVSRVVGYKDYESPIAVMDVNSNETSFSIILDGKLESARYINFGSEHLVKNIVQLFSYDSFRVKKLLSEIPDITANYDDFSDESRFLNAVKTSMGTMLEEVSQVVRFYNSRTGNKPVQSVLLTGKGFEIREIERYFAEYFSIPVYVLKSEEINQNIDHRLFASLMGAMVRRGDE